VLFVYYRKQDFMFYTHSLVAYRLYPVRPLPLD